VIQSVIESNNGIYPCRVCDFGCGRGDLLAELKSIDGIFAKGIDISKSAVDICRERNLDAEVADKVVGDWQIITATEVLEHFDDDAGLIKELQKCCDTLIYSVPWNCLPPGLEPEHRRVYTKGYVKRITPNLKEIKEADHFLVVISEGER
jgi:SAM-dependent methyltransferase